MRLPLLSICLSLACLTACISPKKAAERYQPRIDTLDSLAAVQQDTINSLILALERSRGGNDMLLETQSRLQDRLLEQDDRIEALEQDLSSTSSEMADRLAELRRELAGNEGTLDSLMRAQSQAITQYSEGLRRAANRLSDSLELKFDSTQYEIVESPGEITLSVQEMVLFRPRSVAYLANGNEAVLQVVTEILDNNPLLKLRIVGHTDNQPNPLRGTDNWKYGALRATKLADELATTYYVSPNRLIAASQGEYGPTRSNATEEGRAFNRRIDFVFTSSIANLIRELDKVAQRSRK
jgi:flagellar motor protein MotB